MRKTTDDLHRSGRLAPVLAAVGVTAVVFVFVGTLLWAFLAAGGADTFVIGIIAIYVAACFLGGFLEGKMMKTRKFLWGGAFGLLYFAVLAIISLAVGQGFSGSSSHFVTTLILCMAGGTLGGMVS